MSNALALGLLMVALSACATAGSDREPFAGVVAGIATISADARAIVEAESADVSLYKPENGAALNVFAGVHFNDYFSVQGNYVWNRNVLMLSSVRSAGGSFFEERRTSGQNGVIADGLLYFRDLDSWARPYLSAGAGLVHFQSSAPVLLAASGSPVRPPASFASTSPAFRVAVGIDIGSAAGWRFRYSFSETISRNPVSAQLSPPAQRNLANFQNLFGAIRTF
jgi:hypothetical protein